MLEYIYFYIDPLVSQTAKIHLLVVVFCFVDSLRFPRYMIVSPAVEILISSFPIYMPLLLFFKFVLLCCTA